MKKSKEKIAGAILNHPLIFQGLIFRTGFVSLFLFHISALVLIVYYITCNDCTQILTISMIAISFSLLLNLFIARSVRINMRMLQETRDYYKTLVENQTDLVVKTDKKGNLLFVSPSYCKMFGKEESELLGKPYMPLVHEEDRESTTKTMQSLYHAPFNSYVEQRMLTRDGWLWVGWENKSILDDAGNVIGIIGVGRNIQRQKTAEQELLQNKKFLQDVFDAIQDGICVIDKEFNIISINKSMELGYPPGTQLVGRKCFECFTNSSNPCSYCPVARTFKTGTQQVEVTKNSVPLKGECWIELSSYPIFDDDGQLSRVIEIVHDITEMKNMEMALRKNSEEKEVLLKEAIEYNHLKTEFFSNISHELRTPLNILFSTLQLLNYYIDKDMINDPTGKVRRHMDIMKQNCYRLLKLINNLIDITKIDSGYTVPQIKNYNIVNLVKSITLSAKEYVESKGIQLSFQPLPAGKYIPCDSDMIERIMLNLLSNAVKFTKKDGKITVRIYETTHSLCISVEDTGIGIPEDKLDVIFERFRQVNSTLIREHEGSGIGLSLVKSLVELQGGQIFVESTYGVGTKFTVEFPYTLVNNISAAPQDINEVDRPNRIQKINVEFSDIYTAL